MLIKYFLLRVKLEGQPDYEVAFEHLSDAHETYATTYAKIESKPPYEVVETTLLIEERATHL